MPTDPHKRRPAIQIVVGSALVAVVGAGVVLGASASSSTGDPHLIVADPPSSAEAMRLERGVTDAEYRAAVNETVACLRSGGITVSSPTQDSSSRWSFQMSYDTDDFAEADRVYTGCYEELLDQVEATWLDEHADDSVVQISPQPGTPTREQQHERRAAEHEAEMSERRAHQP